MKGKKISIVVLFLIGLSLTSCQENVDSLEKNKTISAETSAIVKDDELVLNSEVFKALVENRKRRENEFILNRDEQQKLLYEELGLNTKERRDLLDRSMQQSQKVRAYLEANPAERQNRREIEKQMLDADVLEYRSKSRLIREKYVGESEDPRANLHKEFQEKFPNVSSEDLKRLLNIAREDTKSSLKVSAEKVEDAVILNSKEFKAVIENSESSQTVFALAKDEHMKELKNAGLNEEQIKDLSIRSREQSQKRMEYLKDPEHYAEMSKDRAAFDKQFFDEDVLAYKNKMRELADKYDTDPLYRKQNELLKQLKEKFPSINNPEEFGRLMKLAQISE